MTTRRRHTTVSRMSNPKVTECALIAAGNASVQDAASVGTTLKTVAARIRSSEADYDKDAPDYEGLAESASKYRKEIMALSGVDIMKNENEYKSTKQIFEEIAGVWNQMSDVSQAALAERLGGKRNMNVVMSIIQNIKDLKGAYEDSMTAAGTAAEANEIYMDSISGKVGQFKAQWDVFSYTTLDSGLVKPFVGGATELLSILTSVINTLKQLGPVLPVASMLAFGKGIVGISKDLKDVNGVIGVVSKKIYDFGRNSKASFQLAGEWAKNNPMKAIGVGVAATAVAVGAQIAYLNSYTKKYKDFQSGLEKKQSLDKEVSSLNSAIEANRSRMSTLEQLKNSASGLSAVDKAELGVLKEQTAELERQKAIKESLASAEAKTTGENALALTNTKTGLFDMISSAFKGDYKEYRTNLFEGLTPTENVKNNVGALKEYIAEREKARKKLEGLKKNSRNKDLYEHFEQDIDNWDSKIIDTQSNLADNISALSTLTESLDQSTPQGRAKAEELEKVIGESMRYLEKTQGKTVFDSIESAVSNGVIGDASKKLSVLAEMGSLSADQVKQFRESSTELDSYMKMAGVSNKDMANYMNDSAKATKNLADSGLNTGVVLSAYSSEIQSLETNLGELNQAEEKLASGELGIGDVTRLSETFPQLADGVDLASGKFVGLSERIKEAKKDTIEGFVETLEDVRDKAGTASEKAVFDDLIASVRALGDTAEVTSKKYGGIGAAIEETNSAASTAASILKEENPDASYSVYNSAIKQLGEYNKVGMFGLGNTKAWDLAVELFGENKYGNITQKNIDKKRTQLEKDIKRWDSALKDVDKNGNLTNQGAINSLSILKNDKGFMERINKMGDTFKEENGVWDIQIDNTHIKALADEVGIADGLLQSMFVHASQFLDIDWNKNNAKDYIATLESGYDIAGKNIDVQYDDIIKGAEKLGISTTEYVAALSDQFGKHVVVIDKDLEEVSKKRMKREEKNRKKANKAVDEAVAQFTDQPSEHTDRHQGRKKEPPKDAWAYDNKPKGTQDKKEEKSVNDLTAAYQQYNEVQDEIKRKGIDTSKTVFGNIDTNKRQVLEWTKDSVDQYKEVLKSWGENPQELIGSRSTVFGASEEFDGVEIAFSPMLQTDSGAVLLSSDTIHKYINGLLQKTGEGWTTEDLLKLDSEGLEVDGQKVKNMIADVGDTAKQTGEAMHYVGKDGALADAANNLDAAAKSAADAKGKLQISEATAFPKELLNGKSVDEFIKQLSDATGLEIEIVPEVVPEADLSKVEDSKKELKDNWENIENPPKVPLETDDNFIDEARDKLDKTLPKVPVEADTSKAEKEVKQTKDNWERIENPPKIPLETDGSFIDQAKDKLDKTLPTVEVGADTSKADEKVKQTKDNWENIPSDVKVDADTSTADEEVKHAKDNWENIPSDVKVDADTSGADKEVDKVKAGIESSPAKITVEADTKPAEKKIDKVKQPDYSGSSDRHQGRQHESEQVKRDSHYAKGAATAVGGKVGSIVKSTVDKIKNGSTQNTMTVDANTSPAQQKINALIQQIEGKTYKVNVDTSGGESGGASITESATKSVTGFAGKIAGLFKNRKVNISANVSGTKDVDNLNKSTKQVKGKKVKVEATPKGESGVKGLTKSVDQVKPKKVDVKANAKGESDVKRLKGGIDKVEGKSVTVKANTTGVGLVDGLLSKLKLLKDKTVNIVTRRTEITSRPKTNSDRSKLASSYYSNPKRGHSNINGTAFKRGTWGAKGSGRALGGEVGRKILRPRIVICV